MGTLDATAAELAVLARNLREAGEEGLRRELTEAIKRAAEPVPGMIRTELPARLPGRYAGVLGADLRIDISVRTGSSDPGVTVQASTRRRRIRRLDAGVLAHPLFGDREKWFDQAVSPGWFTRPNRDAAARVREAIESALDRVKDQIWAGVHG